MLKADVLHHPIVSGTGSWPRAAELYNLCSAFYIILLDE